MQKKEINKLAKSFETMHKKNKNSKDDFKGYWEWSQLYKNRNQRITAWKNSR